MSAEKPLIKRLFGEMNTYFMGLGQAQRELAEARAWMREAAAYLYDPDQWTRAGAADLADRCPVPPDEVNDER